MFYEEQQQNIRYKKNSCMYNQNNFINAAHGEYIK